MNRCIVNELYVEQREYRCTTPTRLQESMINQLRDMLYKQELEAVAARKVAMDATDRAETTLQDRQG